jgi:predicted RNA-binding Zn-ribbon protein involved in translation (DUF1610 family)
MAPAAWPGSPAVSAIIAAMADSRPARRPITPIRLTSVPDPTAEGRPIAEVGRTVAASPGTTDKMLCDRCGAEVYRMHAVWRCPACGFKSDCCGW